MRHTNIHITAESRLLHLQPEQPNSQRVEQPEGTPSGVERQDAGTTRQTFLQKVVEFLRILSNLASVDQQSPTAGQLRQRVEQRRDTLLQGDARYEQDIGRLQNDAQRVIRDARTGVNALGRSPDVPTGQNVLRDDFSKRIFNGLSTQMQQQIRASVGAGLSGMSMSIDAEPGESNGILHVSYVDAANTRVQREVDFSWQTAQPGEPSITVNAQDSGLIRRSAMFYTSIPLRAIESGLGRIFTAQGVPNTPTSTPAPSNPDVPQQNAVPREQFSRELFEKLSAETQRQLRTTYGERLQGMTLSIDVSENDNSGILHALYVDGTNTRVKREVAFNWQAPEPGNELPPMGEAANGFIRVDASPRDGRSIMRWAFIPVGAIETSLQGLLLSRATSGA